ncbi:MAG TPA: VOC family protein [Acidobacteriaceae bacterium]|jgi:PhnB protein|nr:VOC family protein [Acidobacteriaceae bacterium]
MRIQPYLNFNGQCEEAFHTYERVLGGKIVGMFTFGTSPMAAKYPEWANKVMHVGLAVGDEMILGSDVPPEYFEQPQGLNVCLDLPDVETAERVFAGLSEGGEVKMPLQETFWAKRYAHFVDRFGTPWMINVSKPM